MDSLTISMNMQNNAPSQYINMPFDSVVEFNGKTLFFGPTGIFEEGGDLDNTTEIDAWFDTPNHDFGAREQKKIEAFGIGYETDGEMALTLFGDEDEDTAREFVLEPVKDTQVQQDFMMTLRRYRFERARYWKVRVANRDGSDFSADYLALAPIRLKRRALG
jgi:hypothetical protein